MEQIGARDPRADFMRVYRNTIRIDERGAAK